VNYINRVNQADAFFQDEIKKAEELLAAKETYNDEIAALENKSHENLIKNAEALIKKWEELRES
jgi:hypothetical protein